MITLVELPGIDLLGARDYYGTETANDEPSTTFKERVGRCYELAAYAVAFGTAPDSAFVVHGSWHGPNARERIGHAWVDLGDGAIWEPITAAVYPATTFLEATRAWEEVRYDLRALRRNIIVTEHYGRWHESRYP